ncbi:tyrosine-protein phosphatase non-receptor type 23 isoform X2 [Drosophila novamexicana]|uniref:tyrosine-protein phosphatase non-receptor type 23 isoform X2 n=1 Tax=Drosophila novamexicana TaxID=47314 RepID=UPI0011E5DE3C|nr:tyrosine-protein phosphatase non-receptor type 23 isoform X2 [Drosophila novamexicana]
MHNYTVNADFTVHTYSPHIIVLISICKVLLKMLCYSLIFGSVSYLVHYKRSQRRVKTLSNLAPVVVTSATHTAPGGYPVTQIPATTYQPHAYGTAYPAQNTGNVSVQMPMPMHMPGAQPPMPGMSPHVAAYPPMPQPGVAAANMNPPSYDMAMANPGPSVMPGGYEKQMPYNPNYAQ